MVKIFSGLFRHLNFVISEHPCPSVNRADGISEIEGKAATGSGERAGEASEFQIRGRLPLFVSIRAHSWLEICT